jgi:hypothetical protein
MKLILPLAIVGGIVFAFFGLRKFYNDYTNKAEPSAISQPVENISVDESPSVLPTVVSGLIHSPLAGYLLHPDGTAPRLGHVHQLGQVTDVSHDAVKFSDGSAIIDPDRWEVVPFCYRSVHQSKGVVVGICRGSQIYEFWQGRQVPTGYVHSVTDTEVVIIHQTGARSILLAE